MKGRDVGQERRAVTLEFGDARLVDCGGGPELAQFDFHGVASGLELVRAVAIEGRAEGDERVRVGGRRGGSGGGRVGPRDVRFRRVEVIVNIKVCLDSFFRYMWCMCGGSGGGGGGEGAVGGRTREQGLAKVLVLVRRHNVVPLPIVE